MKSLAKGKPVPAPSFDWRRPEYKYPRDMQIAIARAKQVQPSLVTIGGEIQLTPAQGDM